MGERERQRERETERDRHTMFDSLEGRIKGTFYNKRMKRKPIPSDNDNINGNNCH